MVQDPYAVLGVSRDASEDEIKQAYRRLAKKYHPDLHPGDAAAAAKMNELNEAYDAIKNPQQQSRTTYTYNPYGSPAGQQPGGEGTYYSYGPFGFGFEWRNGDPFSRQSGQTHEYGQTEYSRYEYRRPRRSFLWTLLKWIIIIRLLSFLSSCLWSGLLYPPRYVYNAPPQSSASQQGRAT